MIWVVGGLVVVAVLGTAGWLLAPTLRAFRGPAFEPASKDDESIVRAQQSGNSAGAGGGGL